MAIARAGNGFPPPADKHHILSVHTAVPSKGAAGFYYSTRFYLIPGHITKEYMVFITGVPAIVRVRFFCALVYYMSDIQLLIGQSSSEGERKKKERMRLKRQNLLPSGEADICPSNGRVDKCPPILEYRDKEIRDKSIENRQGDKTHAYGRYRNVFLSSAELAELQTELLSLWEQYIERLSEYMESSGKGYKNHAATIRRWANADKKKEEPPARNRDYSVEEGETI